MIGGTGSISYERKLGQLGLLTYQNVGQACMCSIILSVLGSIGSKEFSTATSATEKWRMSETVTAVGFWPNFLAGTLDL